MANLINATSKAAAGHSNKAPANNTICKTSMTTWSALFRNGKTTTRSLLDFPPEIIDMILGYTCSSWAVTVVKYPSTSFGQRGTIVISPQPQTAGNGLGLIPLAATNSLLYQHLKRCLHTPDSFSGYTQLFGFGFRTLRELRGHQVLLDPCIGAFWPNSTPKQVLDWILSATTVLEMKWTTRTVHPTAWDIRRFFPKLERVILMTDRGTTFSTSTVKEVRATVVSQMREIDWSGTMGADMVRRLIASGLRVTVRVTMVHPSTWGGYGLSEPDHCVMSRDHHPMILSMEIKGISLPDDPADIHIRMGPRDFHSPCCSKGRLNDLTVQYAFADLANLGLQFKPVTNQYTQPCDICRHWRLMWSGVNGDRKRFIRKNEKTSRGTGVW